MHDAIDTAATDRADRDHAAISALGITTSLDGRSETFFPHGTHLGAGGAKLARRDRAEFLAQPGLEEGMDELPATVERECRADHWADLGACQVDALGQLATEPDLRSGVGIPRLIPSETGWSRLAAFAPAEIAAGLRTNINAWARRRRGDEVRLRTRDTEQGSARELYAVVSPKYVPYALDAIATDVAQHLPADARVRVRYDRQRARVDAVLHNPHHFPDSSGTASVGEAHRLTLRITTADDGTGGFALTWAAERIRCVNLTLLRGARTVFRARHTREDLAGVIVAALKAQGEIAEQFAATWRAAWTSFYIDQSRRSGQLDGREALRRIAYHGIVRIPGLRKADVWAAIRDAWEAEPGNTVAHVHNALTRAAHQARTVRPWAPDETEALASEALYQRVHVLADIPPADREELGWE